MKSWVHIYDSGSKIGFFANNFGLVFQPSILGFDIQMITFCDVHLSISTFEKHIFGAGNEKKSLLESLFAKTVSLMSLHPNLGYKDIGPTSCCRLLLARPSNCLNGLKKGVPHTWFGSWRVSFLHPLGFHWCWT